MPGGAGKFTLGKQDSPGDPLPIRLVSQEKIKITYDEMARMWTIVTVDGYRYEFGTKEYTLTYVGSGSTEAQADATLVLPDSSRIVLSPRLGI